MAQQTTTDSGPLIEGRAGLWLPHYVTEVEPTGSTAETAKSIQIWVSELMVANQVEAPLSYSRFHPHRVPNQLIVPAESFRPEVILTSHATDMGHRTQIQRYPKKLSSSNSNVLSIVGSSEGSETSWRINFCNETPATPDAKNEERLGRLFQVILESLDYVENKFAYSPHTTETRLAEICKVFDRNRTAVK